MADSDLPPELPGESAKEYRRRATGALASSRPTDESVTLPWGLGGGVNWIKLAKVLATVIGILVTGITGAVTSYRSAAANAKEQVQRNKDKAEAGYQVTRQAMEELEHRVLVLEEAAHRVEIEAAHQAAARKSKGAHRLPPPAPAPPIPVTVTAHPKVLPSDLDKAERQVYRGTPARPVSTPSDAAP